MILPLVLPRCAQPSAREEAEPPFFMPIGLTLVIGMLVGLGMGIGPLPKPVIGLPGVTGPRGPAIGIFGGKRMLISF
jgi:hypothetical protein